ncbi:MAG: glucose-6-phosphate isomerase, partial [Boseongicola sp.]
MIDAAAEKLEQLKTYREKTGEASIANHFERDVNRFSGFSARCGDVLFDYSKTAIDREARKLLFELAAAAELPAKRDALFSGEHINVTEDRAVQHMALRDASGDPVVFDGEDIMPAILGVRRRMAEFAHGIRDGSIAGMGSRFTDVVNIGIGGSDLGPAMATLALTPYHDGPRIHFVSNIDGGDINAVLGQINAEATLFIVASKTFTTQETMTNAKTARNWFAERCGEEAVGDHFAALSTALDKTAEFGIVGERTFGFWDWVGGRYSVWSAIGLSLMIAIGPQRFEEFLAGANEVDEHFRAADDAQNLPLLMGLVGIWHRNVCGYDTHAVLPYDQHLARFPAYLQQLDMESNGKRIGLDGKPICCETGPIVWGEPGT